MTLVRTSLIALALAFGVPAAAGAQDDGVPLDCDPAVDCGPVEIPEEDCPSCTTGPAPDLTVPDFDTEPEPVPDADTDPEPPPDVQADE